MALKKVWDHEAEKWVWVESTPTPKPAPKPKPKTKAVKKRDKKIRKSHDGTGRDQRESAQAAKSAKREQKKSAKSAALLRAAEIAERKAAKEAKREKDAAFAKINRQHQAEVAARLQGQATTDAGFEKDAKVSLKGARRKVRNRRRRLAALRREGADGAQIDKVANDLRQARIDRNARREAYQNIGNRARLARVRLMQARDAQRRNPKGRGPATRLVDPRLVIGQDEEGKKDPGLKPDAILEEIKAIRRRQKEMGGVVDQERLRILDARLDWMVSRLAGRLSSTIKEAEKLEALAIAGDRKALRKLEQLLDAEETKKIFQQREYFFGRKPGEAGVFDKYYVHRRKVSNRYSTYWSDMVSTMSQNAIQQRNAQARGIGRVMRGFGYPEPATQNPLAPIMPDGSTMPLNPRGGWADAPPEVIAKAMTAALLQRAVEVNPGVRLYATMASNNEAKRQDLHGYTKAAAEAAGVPFEDFELTDPAVVDKAVDAATIQFREDWEAQNGGPVDAGFDVFGFFNVNTNSDVQKARGEKFRMDEEAFRNSLYELYQDRKSPGMIEGLLNETLDTVGLPAMAAMELVGAGWGAFWADIQGDLGPNAMGGSGPVITATRLRNARSIKDLEDLNLGPLIHRLDDDWSGFHQFSDEQLEQLAMEANRDLGRGQDVGMAFNLLDINAWLGGPQESDVEQWVTEQGYDPQQFYVEGLRGPEFSVEMWRRFAEEDKSIQREYFTAFPSAQGLITRPEDQINTPADSNIVYQNAFDEFMGGGHDIGPSSLMAEAAEHEEWQEAFAENPPGTSQIDYFWKQVRLLNEAPDMLQRHPGGGGMRANYLASTLGDPLMLAKPVRVARIFQYGIASGDGLVGKASLLGKELYRSRFGFGTPNQFNLAGGPTDNILRFADSRMLAKGLRKAFGGGDDFTDKQMQDLLEDYVRRTGTDPIVEAKGGFAGFMADLERKVGPQKINNKQLQATSEKYLKRALAHEGIEVIERADQASLRNRTAALRTQADEADLAARRSADAELAESHARGAVRDADAAKRVAAKEEKRSLFETGADFHSGQSDKIGRAAGDFRSPVAHQVEGGFAVRYYRKGLTKAKDSASVVGVGTARHATDIIAIGDSIARRYGLGMRWVRGPKGLTSAGRGRPVIELFGGSREVMAQAADELDILMRKHRLGTKSKGNKALRAVDPSDGRVLFRDRFKDAVLDEASRVGDRAGIAADRTLEKVRLRRSQKKRLAEIKNKELTPKLGKIMDEIESLETAAAAGDQVASTKQAALYKEAKQLEGKIARIESLEDRIITRQRQSASKATTGYGGPLDVAHSEAIIAELGATGEWIQSQLRIARGRLKNDPTNRRLLSYIHWLEEAQIGQRLLAEDLAGPVATARRVVKAHSREAAHLQKASDVAPLVPDKPPAGMSQRNYGLMEIGRSLRARVTRFTSSDLGARATKAGDQWRASVANAKYNRLKLDEFGLDLNGFDEIFPVLRALRRMDVYTFGEHKRISAFLKLQVRYAEKAGAIDWKRLGDDLGMEFADDFDKVEILARIESDRLGKTLSNDLGAFRTLDDDVTAAIRKVDAGSNRPFTKSGGPKRFYDEVEDPGTRAIGELRDYDLAVLQAKQQALKGTGWTVDTYDQARAVLQDTIVREKRMDLLVDLATERSARTGESFAAAMQSERVMMARKLSDEKLRRWAMQSPYGLDENEVWDDFVRSTLDEQLSAPGLLEVSPFQQRMAMGAIEELTGVTNALDNAAWAAGVKVISPSSTFAADARKFLVDMGHWAPKVADDIRQGKKVWSAAEEADYYLANYGFVPDWANTQKLLEMGAFDSEFMYAKVMAEMGVWDNTVDIELRLSALDADAQQLRILWGDEAQGVKQLRSIDDQRKWIMERWGDAVAHPPSQRFPDGSLKRIPWLMDPASNEYKRWLSASTKKYVDDASLMPAHEAQALSEVVAKRMQYNLGKLQEAAATGDNAVLEQELLRQSIKLTDDLVANPRFRKLFSPKNKSLSRNNPLYSLLSGIGYVQRLNVITQFAFGFINAWEVSRFGMKNWLARLYLRSHGGVGLSDVPEFIHKRFPSIESTGLGSGTTIWDRVGSGNFGRAGEALSRLKDPLTRSADDLTDLVVGGVKGIPEIGLIVSARAEQGLKLQMFKRLYTDRFAKFMREGMSEAQADLLARKLAADMTNSFFPSMEGASWWFKALNELVPFLHYNWATVTLYAKEFIAHPWVMGKMEVLGAELERTNRERWELDNPGLPYPRGTAGHKLNIQVGDTKFVIDFLGLSDVARGSRLIAKLASGEEMTVKDLLTSFVRVPHPWQAQLYSYLMDEPSWYTGRRVSLGDVVWPAGVIEWYNDSMTDGSVSTSEWFKLISRMAFFSEAQSLNPLQSMEQAYFALTTDDARRKFLVRFPELREYWATKEPNAAKAILQNNGILPESYFQTVSPEVAAATQKALDLYARERSDWDQKLQSYLDSGGSPLDEAYKELKGERWEAMSDMRNKNLYLFNREMFYNDPLDWRGGLEEDYRDTLYEKYMGFDDMMPQRSWYKSDIEFQKELRDFYKLKGDWLEAHPELFATLGRERSALELAVADVYEEMGEVYENIGERNLEIAKAEAKGKDRLVGALHGINELRYEELEDSTIVRVQSEPPLDVQQAIDRGDVPKDIERAIVGPDDLAAIVSIPGATDQRYRDASPEERKEIRRDFWYREAIQKVFQTSDSGSEFIQRLNKRPGLRAEYLARLKETDPAAYENWMNREYYHKKLDSVMAVIKATGDWSHWWNALDNDSRFRRYYMRTHPEKYSGQHRSTMRNFKKLGSIVAKAEKTGDWSHFWKALKKNDKLREWWLSQEPGRKRKWEENAAYLAKLSPVVQKAVRTGDWKEFNRLLRTDPKFRDAYFKRNPDKKQSWLQGEAYGSAMARWATMMKKNPEKGMDYFDSLPKWMQKRYYASSPQNARSASSNAYTRAMSAWGNMFDTKGASAAMAYFHSLPASIREQYYRTHPGQRAKFQQNDAYGSSMKKWVSFFDKKDYDGAEKYFNSMPLWMRQRYFSNNPDKKPGPGYTYPVPDWKMDEKFGKQLAEFYQLDAKGRAAMLKNNPRFRRYFKDRGNDAATRRAKILAGYEALPDDPWLKRAYQERYPEVFGEEAEGARRSARVEDFLDENPGIVAGYKDALEGLTQTYMGSVQYYGALPKPLEVDRLNEERKRRRRRTEALRHKGELKWDLFKKRRHPPGLENVTKGIA